MAEQSNDAGFQQNIRAQGQPHNPLLNIRDRLFYALFCRVGLLYARSVPRQLQRTLEFLLLFEALVAFGMLTYIHVAFVREPVDCLHHVHKIWPKDGILRVEIMKNASDNYTLLDSYRKVAESSQLTDTEPPETDEPPPAETGILEAVDAEHTIGKKAEAEAEEQNETRVANFLLSYLQPYFLHFKQMARMLMREDAYIVEYSLEHGFLRMTPKTRNRLNITVMLVVLDPTKDECFGGSFSQLMLEEFFGYEDVLLSSLQHLAQEQNISGFFRNVISGDHYRFVEVSVSRISYVTAAFLMIFFTLSISMLLRYAHQQIFLFIVDLLQLFDRNALVTFPLSPLLTAVLALIGVEALMSELFVEASTAFYVVLIVWLADQYDVICCHTSISRRYWLRFFYLYEFIFYAYHYRFNGHFSSISLATSWLFIQHSMVYFFHHYELPAIIQQARVQRLLIHAQQQTMALQNSMREGSDPISRSDTSVRQTSNIGAVVALLPENGSNMSDGEGTEVSMNRSTPRRMEEREGWNLFSLPTFRFSNSLILTQVFVRRSQESRQGFSQPRNVNQSEESTSIGGGTNENHISTSIRETSSQTSSQTLTNQEDRRVNSNDSTVGEFIQSDLELSHTPTDTHQITQPAEEDYLDEDVDVTGQFDDATDIIQDPEADYDNQKYGSTQLLDSSSNTELSSADDDGHSSPADLEFCVHHTNREHNLTASSKPAAVHPALGIEFDTVLTSNVSDDSNSCTRVGAESGDSATLLTEALKSNGRTCSTNPNNGC